MDASVNELTSALPQMMKDDEASLDRRIHALAQELQDAILGV